MPDARRKIFLYRLPSLLGAIGAVLEFTLLRRLYERDHLSQVLATFALILIANESVRMIWGPQQMMLNAPAALDRKSVV